MDNAPASPPPAAPGPAGAPPSKGLHPLVWVAIGCGGLLFLGVLLAIALGVLAYHRAKEHVYTRDGKTVFKTNEGEVTVEGEEGSGTFEVTTNKGTMKVQSGAQAKLPDWLPAYPGGTPKGSFTMKIPDGESVMCTWTTADAPAKVQQFYQKALQDAGLEVTAISSGGEAGGILAGRDKTEKRVVHVAVTVERGQTAVQVTCQTKSGKEE